MKICLYFISFPKAKQLHDFQTHYQRRHEHPKTTKWHNAMSTDERGTQWTRASVVKRSSYRSAWPGIILALHDMVSVNYWFVFKAFRLLTLIVVNINLMPSNVLITGNRGSKNSRAITVVVTEADRCWMEAGGKCRCNWYCGLINTLQWRHMGVTVSANVFAMFIINDW